MFNFIIATIQNVLLLNFLYQWLNMEYILLWPGWTWITCSLDDTCARWCIKKYMYNHETTCADDLGLNRTVLKCHDYGRIYAAGPDACSDSTSGCDYEYAVRQVCYNYVPGDGTGSDHATRPDTENDCVVWPRYFDQFQFFSFMTQQHELHVKDR